jgi:hypothetical protein
MKHFLCQNRLHRRKSFAPEITEQNRARFNKKKYANSIQWKDIFQRRKKICRLLTLHPEREPPNARAQVANRQPCSSSQAK